MIDRTAIVKGSNMLTRGEMDNVSIEDDCVELEQAWSRYVPSGCYTARATQLPACNRVLVSWGADVPEGTAVEVQARVLVNEKWSDWYGFGRWSPYIGCEGIWQSEQQARPYVRGGCLYIPQDAAVGVQLRAYLYSNDEKFTPSLYMLAASADPQDWPTPEIRHASREIRLPAYCQVNRSPKLKGASSGPATLAALINRFGRDILPEEIAMAGMDMAAPEGEYNSAFAAAAAGAYGFLCWQAFMDEAALREEIRMGSPVMCMVNYAGSPEESTENAPWMEGVTGDADRHWLAVKGFTFDEDKKADYVLVCDPMSGTDYGAERAYLLSSFLKAFTGWCVLLRKGERSGKNAPQRKTCQMKKVADTPNTYTLHFGGSQIVLPTDEELARRGNRCIIGCTVQDGKAYATTAHKTFRFGATVTPNGALTLPESVCKPGRRAEFYYIDVRGLVLVGQTIIPDPPPEAAPASVAEAPAATE